jgi:virulence factor Mce-like protein
MPVRILILLVSLGGLIGGVVFATSGGAGTYTLTADFAETPGLYPGNFVDVLGIRVGHVITVTPHPDHVTVVMHIDRNIRIPVGANALLMAPNVVNDRYVQLEPAYTAGPYLASGAVIATPQTADPVSPDEVISSLDQLAVALGPHGANANGALSQLLHSAAAAYANDGPQLHQFVSSFGQALGALSSDSPALESLINDFGGLTHAAAQATGQYQRFAGDLTTVSEALAGDSTDIRASLSNLQGALGQIAAFVRTNGTALGASVANLSQVAASIGQQQKTLAQLLSVAPLTLQNVANAYDPHPAGGGGPALRTRYDPVSGSAEFANSICGNSILRLLVLAVDQNQDKIPNIDLGCGVAYALQTLPVPPGGTTIPNMTLQSLVGRATP